MQGLHASHAEQPALTPAGKEAAVMLPCMHELYAGRQSQWVEAERLCAAGMVPLQAARHLCDG